MMTAEQLEKKRQAARRFRTANPDKQVAYLRKCKYGITSEQYDVLMQEQSGLCKICHTQEVVVKRNSKTQSLSVDHNHETGEIRGLLCNNCNTLIGLAREDISILENAADYLRRQENICL